MDTEFADTSSSLLFPKNSILDLAMFSGRPRRDFEDNLALKHLEGCSRILDVGCGNGRFMKLVGTERIVGIEQNPETVSEVEEAGFEVFQGDALELEKLNRRFDAIHCSHILEHLYPEQVHAFLKSMDAVLDPGGTFVVRGPLLSDWFFDDLSHIRPYTPHVFKRYLTADGGGQKSHEGLGPYDVVNLYNARLPLVYIRHARGKLLWTAKRFFDTLSVRTPLRRIKADQFVMVFRKQE